MTEIAQQLATSFRGLAAELDTGPIPTMSALVGELETAAQSFDGISRARELIGDPAKLIQHIEDARLRMREYDAIAQRLVAGLQAIKEN